MESGTRGTWTDFSVNKPPKKEKKEGEDENSSGGEGGGQGENSYDRCRTHLREVSLEEVARCDYFKKYGVVPKPKTAIALRTVITAKIGRIVVFSIDDDTDIGYLPTKYNYIRGCVADGFSYAGVVISSSGSPVPKVYADLNATK